LDLKTLIHWFNAKCSHSRIFECDQYADSLY